MLLVWSFAILWRFKAGLLSRLPLAPAASDSKRHRIAKDHRDMRLGCLFCNSSISEPPRRLGVLPQDKLSSVKEFVGKVT